MAFRDKDMAKKSQFYLSDEDGDARKIELATYRTKMANQRTFMIFLVGIKGIIALAANYHANFALAFGALMLLGVGFQYFYINQILSKGLPIDTTWLDYMPLLFIPLIFVMLYLQWIHHKTKKSRRKKMIPSE
tara:strand:- start:38 stop:436 length:399 start_codon:yes stop_codon:yes gene_type:complete